MKPIPIKGDKEFFGALCCKFGIVAFILFGSQATKKTTALSDLDIGYIPGKSISTKAENQLFLEITKRFKRDDVDLVDLKKAPLLLRYSVINCGKTIAYANEKILYNFIVETRRNYLDTSHIRSILSYYLAKRINLGLLGKAK